MAMPEQFSLRWNDFHSNLSQSFHALLEGEDMVDVTLAAGGHYLHAHKLILSVCSPYFKELFKVIMTHYKDNLSLLFHPYTNHTYLPIIVMLSC